MKPTPSALTRRRFIATSGMAMLAMPLRGQTIAGANDTVRIALLGCGRRGAEHAQLFGHLDRVTIAAICDPDTAQMDRMAAKAGKKGIDLRNAARFQDFRRVLDRDDIDAVTIAAPNHWHAPLSIHALAAGKDVYVEKPVTHHLGEGKKLVAAARTHDRIVSAGLQNRSDPGPVEGIRFVQEGHLGKIQSVHCCCFRNRSSIGKRDTPLSPPASVDYNLWLGPAQDLPMYRAKFHYDWHWVWNTGNGDTGNQAPHEIDLVCWILGDRPLPSEVHCFGGRFAWKDGGETPNMMTTWYEQNGIPVILEVNDINLSPDRNVAAVREGVRVGIIVRCEGGTLRGGRGGMYAVGEDGKTHIQKFPGDGGAAHQQRFINAVRSRDRGELPAQIDASERSAAIAHLANISYRAGERCDAGALGAAIDSNPLLQTIVKEQGEQLSNWGVNQPEYTLGRRIQIDPDRAEVTTPEVDPQLVQPSPRTTFQT